MRLFDLLDKLMNNENLYAIKDESMFGVRYRKHSGFMICGRDGTYVEHPYTFDKEMTEDDSWLIKSVVIPKYKIGDRFLLYDTVGKIIGCHQDNKKGKVVYTVSFNKLYSPILLNEDYLSKLDMVVSQD